MSVYNIINSSEFPSKNQFERRKIVKDNILTAEKCEKGYVILCFENEILSTNLYFYNKANVHDTCHLTIGQEYLILDCDKKRGVIKIKNDKGDKVWVTYKRFIYSLSHMRKEKLKKLNN